MADYRPDFFIMTPEKMPKKTAIENLMVQVITLRLKTQERTKHWLSAKVGIDYGKVKRVLNEKEAQQLSFSTADDMLAALGSSVKEAMLDHVVSDIRNDVESGHANIANGLANIEEGLADIAKGLADIEKAMTKLKMK